MNYNAADLAKLERITDLRSVWKNEALDFTPWLARDENITLLGDAIGANLEVKETESSVGSFNVDIFAIDVASGRKVIIENQLEATDHDHLGKTITYASGKGAQTVVWVVSRAREEHAQAISWLNTHADEEVGFFLLEIELWRIGSSPIAPRFNVVESPNEWGKVMKDSSSLSRGGQLQLDFWSQFNEIALTNESFKRQFSSLQKPYAQSWKDLSIGKTALAISLTVDTRKKQMSCGFYVRDNKEFFDEVLGVKKDFEDALGSPGVPVIKRKDCCLRFYKEGFDLLGDRSAWQAAIDWLMDSAVKMKLVYMNQLADRIV